MVFLALEFARHRVARVGMMLAAVFVEWEDHGAARWRLGRDGGIRRREGESWMCAGTFRRSLSSGLGVRSGPAPL